MGEIEKTVIRVLRSAGGKVSTEEVVGLGNMTCSYAAFRAAVHEIRLRRVGLEGGEYLLSDSGALWITKKRSEVKDFIGEQSRTAKRCGEVAEAMEKQLFDDEQLILGLDMPRQRYRE